MVRLVSRSDMFFAEVIHMDNKIHIFEDKSIRTAWNAETEEWYFSVVDVVSVLTDSVDGRKYWNKLKQRLKEEGNETVTNCHQLKMKKNQEDLLLHQKMLLN